MAPAFMEIRAAGFLTDSMKVLFPQVLAHLRGIGCCVQLDFQPFRLFQVNRHAYEVSPVAIFWQTGLRKGRPENLEENPCERGNVSSPQDTNMNNESGKHRVLSLREMGAGTFVLRMERRNLDFVPGQYIHVGPVGGIDRREYSVYSSPGSDFLEILVKEVETGSVSPRLKRLGAGDLVDVEGPVRFLPGGG